jgi:WD40 repeat protein
LVQQKTSLFAQHEGPVVKMIFSENEETVISAANDGSIVFWWVRSGDVIKEFTLRYRVTSLSFDEKSDKLFAADALDNQFIATQISSPTINNLHFNQRYRYFRQAIFRIWPT